MAHAYVLGMAVDTAERDVRGIAQGIDLGAGPRRGVARLIVHAGAEA
jgi:hypothetical protein